MKRVCLLTGASGLLGTRFIECCAERYQIIAAHNQNAISYATQEQEFVDPLSSSSPLSINHHRVYSIRADLREPAQIDNTIREVKDRFGGIDLLINGAAVRHWCGLLETGGIDRAQEILDLNVLAPLRLSVGLAHAFWNSD